MGSPVVLLFVTMVQRLDLCLVIRGLQSVDRHETVPLIVAFQTEGRVEALDVWFHHAQLGGHI